MRYIFKPLISLAFLGNQNIPILSSLNQCTFIYLLMLWLGGLGLAQLSGSSVVGHTPLIFVGLFMGLSSAARSSGGRLF